MNSLTGYSSENESCEDVAVNQNSNCSQEKQSTPSFTSRKVCLSTDLFGVDRSFKRVKKSDANISLPTILTHYEEPEDINPNIALDACEEEDRNVLRFSMDHFYRENQDKIAKGELDSDEIITRSSKIEYSANTGRNSLSRVIAFTSENEKKIDKAHQQKPSKHNR